MLLKVLVFFLKCFLTKFSAHGFKLTWLEGGHGSLRSLSLGGLGSVAASPPPLGGAFEGSPGLSPGRGGGVVPDFPEHSFHSDDAFSRLCSLFGSLSGLKEET